MNSSSAKGLFIRVLNRLKAGLKSFGTVKMAAHTAIQQQDQQVPVYIIRMDREVYEKFEKGLPSPGTPKDGVEAAYLLGMQAVLKQMREKLVVKQ